jgi:HAD superfamily 5'-nucleotidase-like hydrolase
MTTEPELGALPPLPRRVFCNRTLNLRSIQAVGCDMDYTLVHYHTEVWEARAYEYVRDELLRAGLPVEDLEFRPDFVSLGLVVDIELGNLVKANRFGHVRKACHGTRMLSVDERRRTYTTAPIDLAGERWRFMNTLFTLSESCIYMQLIDKLDAGKLPRGMGPRELYAKVTSAVDVAHLEGKLKADIVADPERYVHLDEELPRALLDLSEAGKKLLLITNSEWEYTNAMMAHAFDRFLPPGGWRQLFDLVVVQARKPNFFSREAPAFRLVDEQGLYRPHFGPLNVGDVYLGGDARQVERSLGLSGDDILYLGDHIFADVHVSKDLLRWRTALVVRELEQELEEQAGFADEQHLLSSWMDQKELWEHEYSQLRLQLQRAKSDTYDGPPVDSSALRHAMHELRSDLVELDDRIAPLARKSSQLLNERWGPLMRCGNDKSHLARQIERYADIYMSRVSNLLAYTPFVYLRAPRGSLPHDSTGSGI